MMQPELAAESTREALLAAQGALWSYKQQVRIMIALDIESLSSQANFQDD